MSDYRIPLATGVAYIFTLLCIKVGFNAFPCARSRRRGAGTEPRPSRAHR
jgi:hypothetical protein